MQYLSIFTHLRNPQTIEKISLSPPLYHTFSGTGGRDDAGKFSTRSETQFPRFARAVSASTASALFPFFVRLSLRSAFAPKCISFTESNFGISCFDLDRSARTFASVMHPPSCKAAADRKMHSICAPDVYAFS